MVGNKWPDVGYRAHDANVLGEDDHGTWLWVPGGTVVSDLRQDSTTLLPCDFLTLVPPDTWWTATYMFGWNDIELYVDLATPANWSPFGLTLVDMDLDVVRKTDGRVELWDEDEFLEHQVDMGYPADVVETVSETAAQLLDLVSARDDPFGGPPQRWLGVAQGVISDGGSS